MPLALVFDVETTGLLPTPYSKPTVLAELPHIIQLSWVIYDTDQKCLIKKYNTYVRPPSDVVIKPIITELTGITRELVDSKGIDVGEAIECFYAAYLTADILVAHNMSFDINMILLEGCPIWKYMHGMFDFQVLQERNKQLYCTMQEGIDLCKIERMNRRGIYYKQPKLSELYTHLFGKSPENLHDSAVDVAACLRCFLKMHCQIDVCDNVYNSWV